MVFLKLLNLKIPMKSLQRRKKEFCKKILKELKNLINLKIEFKYIAGWSSLVARQAHNLKVGGSNPSPATNSRKIPEYFNLFSSLYRGNTTEIDFNIYILYNLFGINLF